MKPFVIEKYNSTHMIQSRLKKKRKKRPAIFFNIAEYQVLLSFDTMHKKSIRVYCSESEARQRTATLNPKAE